MRRAAAAVCLLALVPSLAVADRITDAVYETPTRIYPHGVLGDDLEWRQLVITVRPTAGRDSGTRRVYRISAPGDSVFEDLSPRLWDITGDGLPEVVVVQSDQSAGARLRIFGLVQGTPRIVAETPPIGARFRWLAPVGAADFDGDGAIEVAYVDRPHLARTLRIWRYDAGRFEQVASAGGVSNHRIGEDVISGGVRDCGAGPEMIVASADWASVVVARFDGAEISLRAVLPLERSAAFDVALRCAD